LWAHKPDNLSEAAQRWKRFKTVRTMVWHGGLIDSALVETSTFHGFQTLAYGLNSPEAHRRCVEAGVFGLITDHPQWAQDCEHPLRILPQTALA